MNKVEHILAEKLISISAIQLQPDNPFTWGSGWNSPIYTDNRKTLSYPDVRTFVKLEFSRIIAEHFPGAEAVAGVSTGAIAQGALVADALGLPYAFVRSTPKDHGLENLIEGNLKLGQKVVLIEDIVSTGANLVKAMQAISNAGCDVIGMVALFDFVFPASAKAFDNAGIEMIPLCTFPAILKTAREMNYITADDVETLMEWHRDPVNWTK